MAKVYLFRKIDRMDELQASVFEEASNSLVTHIMNGSMGTIFNYGEWPSYQFKCNEGSLDASDKDDILPRVVHDIFKHVYSMALTIEINISIGYHEISEEKQRDLLDCNDVNITETDRKKRSNNFKHQKQHFVSSPKDVFNYIEKKLKHKGGDLTRSGNMHSLFVVKVKQTNLEMSKKLNGKLNIVQFNKVETMPKHEGGECGELTTAEEDTPMCALHKIVSALAGNTKTHMRYHNIRLMRILKDTVGSRDNTVIINFGSPLDVKNEKGSFINNDNTKSVSNLMHQYMAEDWRELYRMEHEKCKRFKQLVVSGELVSNKPNVNAENFLESIERQFNSGSVVINCSNLEGTPPRLIAEIEYLNEEIVRKENELNLCQRQCVLHEERIQTHEQTLALALAEQEKLRTEMSKVKHEVDKTLEELLEVQHVIEQLKLSYEHTMDELDKKDKMLNKTNLLLMKTTEDMLKQKTAFRDKLNEFSVIFTKLWRQQGEAMLQQEKEREKQLGEMFDAVCHELRVAHTNQLKKLRAQTKKEEAELKKLCECHQELLLETPQTTSSLVDQK